MIPKLVTIVVTPRETFCGAKRNLDSIFKDTKASFNLIYVDGNSPAHLKSWLDEQAKEKSFLLLRSKDYLTPNEARNIAIDYVTTPYVVFIDNDVVVSPGWLQALIDCAEETEAAIVGPLYCEFEPLGKKIHMAGGEAALGPEFYEKHWHQHVPRALVQDELKRTESYLIEFHTVLIRMKLFELIGPMDEKLMSSAEHVDICVRASNAKQKIYIEPKSVITYVPPFKLDKRDAAYFYMRWSDAWNQATVKRLQEKWHIPDTDKGLQQMIGWLDEHRRLGLTWHKKARKIFGKRLINKLFKLHFPIEKKINQLKFPKVKNRIRPTVVECQFD